MREEAQPPMSRRRKSRPPASPPPPPAPAGTSPRGAFAAALALALVGVALSIALARLHVRAHAGESSFCALSDVVNCDRVATSRFSVVLGLPVAVWGAFGYGLTGALAAWGFAGRSRRGATWPAGLLLLVAGVAVAASVALALVSEIAIGALCLLCAASWATSVALLAAAWRACRPPGVVRAVRADLAAARASPAAVAALAAALAAGVAIAVGLYPRYWERPLAAAAPPRSAPVAPSPSPD